MGFEYSSVYAASKAGLEGWMSALDVRGRSRIGIHTTIVNPGFFRTGLASPESLVWPDLSIARLRGTKCCPAVVVSTRRAAGGRPGQAGDCADRHRRRGSTSSQVHRRGRRDRLGSAQDRTPPRGHRVTPIALRVTDLRRVATAHSGTYRAVCGLASTCARGAQIEHSAAALATTQAGRPSSVAVAI